MTFTGKNLTTLHDALCRALDDVKTERGIDPDCDEDELDQEVKAYKRLLYRVRTSLEKEVTQ